MSRYYARYTYTFVYAYTRLYYATREDFGTEILIQIQKVYSWQKEVV